MMGSAGTNSTLRATELGTGLIALALTRGLDDGIAAARAGARDQRTLTSVNRLVAAYRGEQTKSAALEEELVRERGERRRLEMLLAQAMKQLDCH